MSLPSRLTALAERIDPRLARELTSELGAREGRALGVLLGTAYPALRPRADWQLAAVEALFAGGLRSTRRPGDLLDRLLDAGSGGLDSVVALRRTLWAEKARIALRELLPVELGGAPIDVTSRELSHLADATCQVALDEAMRHVALRFGEPRRAGGQPSTLVVFGMGKLGGQELNAGSDIDVVFVYDSDDGAGEIDLHEHWARVVRRLVATIEEPSPDGLMWRVDLRLRPEGSQGPVTNSVAATERYYETWGRLWERAALLRARPVAGDPALGALIEREIFQPFVYRREVEPAVAEALSELLLRSRSELCPDPVRDLKLGPGGIREAEFFVQSLQLIWGGREPSLRVPGTLRALQRLRFRGLVSDREVRGISESYTLLRKLEHRIQWSSGVQTHLLPSDPDELCRIARSLGFEGPDELGVELARARNRVGELFSSLAPRAAGTRHRLRTLLTLLDTEAPDFRAEAERRFRAPEVGDHLIALARRPDGLLGQLTRERFPELGDQVLEALDGSPDPEQAARYLRAFLARFAAPGPYVTALAEEPRKLVMLVTAFGASAFVGEAVVARPELADVILFGTGAVSDPRAALDEELETAFEALGSDADELERWECFVGALRAVKRRVMVEVAIADLAGALSTRETTRILSDLADAELDRAAQRELGGQGGLALLAMGKLGGRDIGYGSDLDVVFIYDPELAPSREEAPEYFARRAQRIIRAVSEPHAAGPGYELDTRLRPSGSQGLLVTSLSSFARYHGVPLDVAPEPDSPAVLASGAPWERQALLRARFCAGDPELGRRAIEVAERAAYEGDPPSAAEMHRLRSRMERDLARERPWRFDLKTGRGGLLDIEFATQWLQMRFGADPAVRTPDTLDALEALARAGHLPRRDFEALRDGYRFLRRLEQRIHVQSGIGSSVIDTRQRGLSRLARRMGFQDGPSGRASDQLLARYASVTTEVRATYERVLGLNA